MGQMSSDERGELYQSLNRERKASLIAIAILVSDVDCDAIEQWDNLTWKHASDLACTSDPSNDTKKRIIELVRQGDQLRTMVKSGRM